MLKVRTGASVAVKVTLAIVDRVFGKVGYLEKKLGEESCVSKKKKKECFWKVVVRIGGGLLMSV